jgi:hypothetical protein
MPETLDEKLAKIERGEKEILRHFHRLSRPGDPMLMSDLVLVGIVKRTVALSDGFRGHIKERNFTCAAALLRLLLDTAMRTFAATLCDSAEDYAKAVFEGKPVNKIKDRDGKLLRDAYLAERLSEKNPWVKPLYDELCNFVHFSNKHIFTSIAKMDEEKHIVYFQVSAEDAKHPDESYFEIVDSYFKVLRLAGTLAVAWRVALKARASSSQSENAAE